MAKIELVCIPTVQMGHLPPIVAFVKEVISSNSNISITFLIFHIPNDKPTNVTSYIESQSRQLDPTRVTFVTLPPLVNPCDMCSPYMADLHLPIVNKAVQGLNKKPAAIILDTMNASLTDVAVELDIPSYIYVPSAAAIVYLHLHIQALADEKGLDGLSALVADPENTQLDLPGFRNHLPVKVFPGVFLEKDNEFTSVYIHIGRKLRQAKGIIVNSVMEFESATFQALEKLEAVPKFYPVGPLLTLNNRGDGSEADKDIMSWLDNQPKGSVVFLCFGTQGSFNAEQVREIAKGLECSGFRFLWSLRKPVPVCSSGGPPSEDEIFEEALPEGFLDRTSQKGKIVPWAPQAKILAHEAIGGFLSHCGWNSILETAWFGVPIATWPLYADQQVNAFLLVKELGVGVEISLDYRWDFSEQKSNYLVKADEVEMGVTKLMNLDKEIRDKVCEMKRQSRQAEGGSSYDSFARFIDEITKSIV